MSLTTLPFSGGDHVRCSGEFGSFAAVDTSRIGLHQLDAISKGIGNVHTVVTFELLLDDINPRLSKTHYQGSQITHEQSRMCLTCRTKVRLGSEMNFH